VELERRVIVGKSKDKSGLLMKIMRVALVETRPNALQGANRAIDAPPQAKTGTAGSETMKFNEEAPPAVL
jgi:hypothetical protein